MLNSTKTVLIGKTKFFYDRHVHNKKNVTIAGR